jgi:hypothetical protein
VRSKNLLGLIVNGLIIQVKKTKKVWFRLPREKNQEGLVQTSQKNKSVQKNLLGLIVNGLIIRVKKTKEGLVQTSQKNKCVQKNLPGFIITGLMILILLYQ